MILLSSNYLRIDKEKNIQVDMEYNADNIMHSRRNQTKK